MIPFVTTQVLTLVENIRLLETFVTAPLGLYADIRMLRESLAIPEAAGLPQAELQERRKAFRDYAENGPDISLETIAQINTALDILERFRDGGDVPLTDEWVGRTRGVLARAEERVASELRAKVASGIAGLYVIVDPAATNGRPVAQVAEASLKGGAGVLQLRDKTSDKGEVLPLARELTSMCDGYGAVFVVNDDPSLTGSSGAHGLHLGQTDLPVAEARRFLAPRQVVGRSNNTLDEALQSQQLGVDYLAVGGHLPHRHHGQRGQKRRRGGPDSSRHRAGLPAGSGHRGHHSGQHRRRRSRGRRLCLRGQRRHPGGRSRSRQRESW